ncbi:Uncharacterized protein MSYG_3738 [Malassezia sympodialis ATCC 42132]|uniref:Uncharacterized protein n=1 Tax=Malassezia sympodialis (strain ATCC 42132) TaxID=1230383 RepID=A0A1M8AAC9_MALS4|nr:Uncharacterized protein MSYG_3738 [Malassezia sympodialis ATCC 42132]
MAAGCWDVLLGHAHAESSRDQAAALAALRELDATAAPEALPLLAAAAAERPLRVLAVLGLVCLVNPALAQALLRDDVLAYAVPTDESGERTGAFAHMLSEGASHPALRQHLKSQPRIQTWLRETSPPSGSLAAACTDLARIKLAIPTDTKAIPSTLDLSDDECTDLYERLAAFVRDHTFAAPTDSAPWAWDAVAAAESDALEGLYYLSSLPALREAQSLDAPLLRKLGGLLSARTSATGQPSAHSSEAFVTVSLLANLVAYPPVLSEQERQVEALRRSATKRGPDDARLAPSSVVQRVRRVVDAGLVPPLVTLTTRASPQLYRPLADLFLSLVTEQDAAFRGRLLQLGVSRALLWLAQQSLAALSSSMDATQLLPFQALAKLTISVDPALMYGVDGAAVRAVVYLGILFLAPVSSLLQVFEAALALTNLASMSPAMATAVAHASCPHSEHKNIADSIVPLFLQHDSLMLRRALMELLCNMAQDDGVFAHWSGETERDGPATTAVPAPSDTAPLRLHTAEGRLRLLLSLCHVSDDVHELALAKAASGLLAMLSSSPVACELLVHLPTDAWGPIAALLPPPALAATDTWELELRALSILLSLCEYAAWLGSPERSAPVFRKMQAAGLVRAVGAVAAAEGRSATKAMPASARALQTQVVSLSQTILQRVPT